MSEDEINEVNLTDDENIIVDFIKGEGMSPAIRKFRGNLLLLLKFFIDNSDKEITEKMVKEELGKLQAWLHAGALFHNDQVEFSGKYIFKFQNGLMSFKITTDSAKNVIKQFAELPEKSVLAPGLIEPKKEHIEKALEYFEDFDKCKVDSKNNLTVNIKNVRYKAKCIVQIAYAIANNVVDDYLNAHLYDPGTYKKEVIRILENEGYELEGKSQRKINKSSYKPLLHPPKHPLNQILYGPPGTGKTYNTIDKAIVIFDEEYDGKVEACSNLKELYKQYNEAKREDNSKEKRKNKRDSLKELFKYYKDKEQIEFVTFHQSYGYEEFVEGIKAKTTSTNEIIYKVESGIFKKLSERARGNKDKRYILIIDEINRGNISKIFGELITLIEDSKRQGKGEHIEITLPYSNVNFSVPSNLYIIGTMNTADRSIAPIDTALRRRFVFKEMQPKSSLLHDKTVIDDQDINATIILDIDLEKLLTAINARIEILYDRDHTIGHAYFIDIKTYSDLHFVFQYKILPLLAEYFYEDWKNIKIILNEEDETNGFIQEQKEIKKYLPNQQNGKTIYKIKDGFTPDDFKRIYSKKVAE